VKQERQRRAFDFQMATKFCMQNGKVGEGDIFSQDKHLYCFSYIQNFIEGSLHSIKDQEFNMEVQQCGLGRGHYFQWYH
jgi:hypothetical protein